MISQISGGVKTSKVKTGNLRMGVAGWYFFGSGRDNGLPNRWREEFTDSGALSMINCETMHNSETNCNPPPLDRCRCEARPGKPALHQFCNFALIDHDRPGITAMTANEHARANRARPSNLAERMPPVVSVIVPHYHDLPSLEICLSALDSQTYPRDRIEIIVADNNSPEGTSAVARVVSGRAKLVLVHERGAAPARNGAVSYATGEVLAFTDCDCQPQINWLTEGIAALEAHDLVGGAMKVLVGDPRHMTPVEAFESIFAFDNEKYVTRKGFTVTANMFCWRYVFDNIGGFCAGVSEDVEWSHRARDNRYTIGYAPRAVVGHKARKNWADLLAKWRRIHVETYALATTRENGRLKWLLRTLALPGSAVVHSPHVFISNRLTSLDQRLGALQILYGLRCWRFGNAVLLLVKDERFRRWPMAFLSREPPLA
jgi:glycosyltransferase involved in cell wall biosynthesis